MASRIITTARWTILSSKQGFPLGLFFPSSFSIHTRSTGGATYRLSRSRSCRSRRLSSRCSAYCVAVTWSHPRGTLLAGLPRGFQKNVLVDHVQHVVAHHRWIALACCAMLWSFMETVGEPGVSPRGPSRHNVMPGVAFPPVGPVGRGSPPSPVLCAAQTPPCPSRVASLVARFPIPRLLHGVRGVLIGLVAWVKPPGHARACGHPVPQSGSCARRQVVLPRSRAPPVKTCPALRPRWCPAHSPYRTQDCCLPALAHRRLLPRYRCGYPADHDSTYFGAQ